MTCFIFAFYFNLRRYCQAADNGDAEGCLAIAGSIFAAGVSTCPFILLYSLLTLIEPEGASHDEH